MGRKAIFLDRDGVLNIPIFKNGRSFAPQNVEDFKIYEGVVDAIERLKKLDYLTIVVTNQPDVGAGLMKIETLHKMHLLLMRELELDDILVCTHTKFDNCACRKPKTGLFKQALLKYDIDFSKSFMIGDRCSDIESGLLVGCRTIFIDRGYTSEEKPVKQDYSCFGLEQAVKWVQIQESMEKRWVL
jgi:D-glycero-D-manno-heptose 1,7-bisphosphate phosphatase